IPLPPRPTLFPYTTLFRSWPESSEDRMQPLPITGPQIPWIEGVANAVAVRHQGELYGALSVVKSGVETLTPTEEKLMADLGRQRSEEHTSELQSRGHLVCR